MFREIFAEDIETHVSRPEFAWVFELHRSLREADGRAPLAEMLRSIPAELSGDINVVRSYGEDDFIYLQCGHNIVTATGADMTGRLTRDFPDELGEFLREVFNWVLLNRAPLLTIHRASFSVHVHLWERLVVPCRDWDGSDRLIVCIKPRELRTALLDAVLDASADMILALRAVRDESGNVVDARIITANRRASEVTRLALPELLDGRMRTLLPGFAEGWIWERCLRVMEEVRRDVFEVFYDRDGIKAWFRITASPITSGFMLTVADISDLKHALIAAEEARRDAEATQATLRRLSVTDALTGLLNRRGFEDMVRMQQANLNRYGSPSALIAVDIDHFKHVNDTFGHAAGDGVLMAIASIFREETRLDLDMAGRVGGEEFMLLLPGSGLSGAQVLAERIRSRIGNEVLCFEGATIHISASLGVSAFRADREPEGTIRAADQALYEAKRRGRNRVVVEEQAVLDERGECAPGRDDDSSSCPPL
ncbi:MAG TPA: sensor domain-containing diguanylate cyclase [Saliniramus sp.]|nr:sensor domain-containing diguanylate cyclase [Saliniramus sp.]